MRGTADQMALAEKLIMDLDKPKPEVVVEVLIMEANRSKVHDIAATAADPDRLRKSRRENPLMASLPHMIFMAR